VDQATARHLNRSYLTVMRAVQRDALSPRRALFWAERLAAGEAAPEQVDQLTAPPGIPREIAAARNIACQVADILSRVQDLAGQVGPQAGAEPYPPGWETLFPDVAAQVGAVGWPPFEPQNTLIGRGHVSMSRPPIVYDGESQGRRRGSLSVVGIVVFSVSRCATVVRMTEDEAKTVAALAAQCAHGAVRARRQEQLGSDDAVRSAVQAGDRRRRVPDDARIGRQERLPAGHGLGPALRGGLHLPPAWHP